MKKGVVQDKSFIESDPGKHGRKKPPVSPDMPGIVPDTKKDTTMTKEEKTQEEKETKIRATEKNRIIA